jgi:hypothetical protein
VITKDQVADVLEASADLYESEQYEWCQGAYYRGDLQVGISMCASQALRTVCGERLYETEEGSRALRSDSSRLDKPLLRAALKALDLAPSGEEWQNNHEGFLITWNDKSENSLQGIRPRRTKQEVIDLFKDKAKELRNQ